MKSCVFDNFSLNPHVLISYLLDQEENGMWRSYKSVNCFGA